MNILTQVFMIQTVSLQHMICFVFASQQFSLSQWIKDDSEAVLVSVFRYFLYWSLLSVVAKYSFWGVFWFCFFFTLVLKDIRALWLRNNKQRQPNSEVGKYLSEHVQYVDRCKCVFICLYWLKCKYALFLLNLCWCVSLPQFAISQISQNPP